MTDIMITLPAQTEWADYESELLAVRDGSKVLNFKVPFFPKHTKPGERCWMVWRGAIRGWMIITEFWEGEFQCSTTLRPWEGKFIRRSGPFHFSEPPILCKGFQGWRYVPDG